MANRMTPRATLRLARCMAWACATRNDDGSPASGACYPQTPDEYWREWLTRDGRRRWLAAARLAERQMGAKR
jgi:hypothetical protein